MNTPQVGIAMGSDSDLPIMQEAAHILEEFGIASEVRVISAHRTPDNIAAFVREAEKKGMSVIIAGAGGAAHLPGMLASYATIPVIGVPIMNKTAGGIDALFSIAQMPPGVPVATVAINGAKNAGILAAHIIGITDEAVRSKLAAYKQSMAAQVRKKDEELQEKGFRAYLEEKGL